MDVDTRGWSGEGSFTQVLIDALRGVDGLAALRVEDAPASRAAPGYNFIVNELFVAFAGGRSGLAGLLDRLTTARNRTALHMDLAGLARRLGALPHVGEPDYEDDGMIQYLRTERVVAPYQTRGIKVVELVRIYKAGAGPD